MIEEELLLDQAQVVLAVQTMVVLAVGIHNLNFWKLQHNYYIVL
jgi:hypothetical protein